MKEVIEKLDAMSEESKANKADLEAKFNEEVTKLTSDLEAKGASIEQIKGELKEFMAKAGRQELMGGAKNEKSVGDQVEENLTKSIDRIKELQVKKGESINFDVKAFSQKAAGTMTITGNYSGGTVGLSDWDPTFARVARRQPFLRQLISVRPTSKTYVAWAEQANPDPGAAGTTAEGAAKTQTDFDIVERNKKVEKITAYIKLSKEMMDDIGYVRSEIQSELVELLELKLDEQIYKGDGTTPNLLGIIGTGYAQAFSVAGTGLALGVEQANNFDVLRAAARQVQVANFVPDYALVHPNDAALMDLAKATDGHYVMPPFKGVDGSVVAGLRIIVNTGVTAGDFLVGDFRKSNLAVRENISITMGYENDDFTKNLITVLAEMRAVHYIKTNHVGAFVKGTFSTAKTAMETA